MKTAYVNCPLALLKKCLDDKQKLKVWTRNHKEVRGICTCRLIAFDKHWNLLVQDIDEVYIRPRKTKTPFLRDIGPNENIPEMQPKVPKQRTQPKPDEETTVKADSDNQNADKSGSEKKKRRKRKKPGPISERRHFPNCCVIRGDNIVMISPVLGVVED
ncbi:U7 snRNA-associated Sm-like protein LSm11 [Stegodyphus dumicola]|uniref:U7 snRNA-associated Sm-like protein LSm11 n=1 Tax=Stegodyphus dumicola TaxID=202533 RepID=UPI0015ADA6DE|nr:U7 snRNA-associated Sm-like protein LSm11 [Stegodyphus dumicola]